MGRRGARAHRRLLPRLHPLQEPEPAGRHDGGRPLHRRFPARRGPRIPRHRAPRQDAQPGRRLRWRRRGQASGAERPYRRVSRGRRRRLDPGPLGRRPRRRQDLRPRRLRHEGRHQRLDLHLCLPPPHPPAPQGAAHPDGGLGRGNLRPLGRPLSGGAPSGGAGRLPAQRRARQSLHDPVRGKGPPVARVQDPHQGRPWRLHPCQRERDQAGPAPDRRSRSRHADRIQHLRQPRPLPRGGAGNRSTRPWARARPTSCRR